MSKHVRRKVLGNVKHVIKSVDSDLPRQHDIQLPVQNVNVHTHTHTHSLVHSLMHTHTHTLSLTHPLTQADIEESPDEIRGKSLHHFLLWYPSVVCTSKCVYVQYDLLCTNFNSNSFVSHQKHIASTKRSNLI